MRRPSQLKRLATAAREGHVQMNLRAGTVLTALLVGAWAGNATAETVVVDGDTIKLNGTTYRLWVSCPRIFWTPICPTGGIHDEVEHEPNRNQRCE